MNKFFTSAVNPLIFQTPVTVPTVDTPNAAPHKPRNPPAF